MAVPMIPDWTEVVEVVGGATSAAPTTVADGNALRINRRGVPLLLAVTKTNTCTAVVWGWSTQLTAWFALETYTFGGDSISHAEPLEYAAAFERIDVQISANGGGTVTAFIGEMSEE